MRDHILFAQDSAQTEQLNKVRYALRGFYDGRTKYARYYGVGGGKPSTGLWGKPAGDKLFDVDCAFDDNDHEWYDHDADPHELVNLANERSRRARAARHLRTDARLRAGVVRRVRLIERSLIPRSDRWEPDQPGEGATTRSTRWATSPRHPASTSSRQRSKSVSSP